MKVYVQSTCYAQSWKVVCLYILQAAATRSQLGTPLVSYPQYSCDISLQSSNSASSCSIITPESSQSS